MESIKVNYGRDQKLTGEFVRTASLVQSFTAKNTCLKTIGVNFATYFNTNMLGRLTFEIYDDKTSIFKKNADLRLLKNNEFFEMDIDIPTEANKRYYLHLYCLDGLSGNLPTAKYGKDASGELFILNKQELPNSALYCYFVYNDTYIKPVEKTQSPVKALSSILLIDKGPDKPAPATTVTETIAEKEPKEQPKKRVTTPPPEVASLITIIIPTYNTSKYLKLTLESICKQTYNNVEIIVSDDKSSDAEKLKISQLVRDYKDKLNITMAFNRVHKGAPTNRNLGLYKAAGEFVFFCDSDVVLESTCLSKMLQTLHDNPDCSWVYCNYKLGEDIKAFQEFNVDVMYHKNICSTMSLIRRKDCPRFNMKLQRLQDWELFLTMIEKGKKGKWINEVLFTAAKRADGITANSISWEEAVAAVKLLHPKVVA